MAMTTVSKSGIDDIGGWIVVSLFCLVAAAIFVVDASRYRRYAVATVGFLTASFSVLFVSETAEVYGFDRAQRALMTSGGVQPRVGIYLVMVGGVLLVASALASLASSRKGGDPAPDGQRSEREGGATPSSSTLNE